VGEEIRVWESNRWDRRQEVAGQYGERGGGVASGRGRERVGEERGGG